MYHSVPSASRLEELANEIRHSSPRRRLELQPEFGRLLMQREQSGEPLPSRLWNLHEQLLEEAIEDRFDNLPI